MDQPPRNPLRDLLNGIHTAAAAALEILREALRISAAGWKFFIPITLSVLLPFSLLSLSHQLLFDRSSLAATAQTFHSPIFRRAAAALKPGPGSPPNGNILVFADFGFRVTYWILGLFELTVTVFGASAACREDRPRVSDLLRSIRREWRGPVATQLCVSVLKTGYWALLGVLSDALVPLAAGPTSLLLMVLGSLLFLSGNLLYYYLDVAWESSVAASAVDSCGGFRALGLAGELTEGRQRRLQGVIVALLCAAVTDATSLLVELLLELTMAEVVRAALTVVFGSVFELMYMYKIATFTVFYYRCRGSRWEEGSQYSRLSTSPP